MIEQRTRRCVAAILAPVMFLFTGSVEAQSRPDLDGDGFADIAVGMPNEDFTSIQDGGAVGVLYGTTAGVTGAQTQLWHQNRTGVPEKIEPNDAFGNSLVTGDFNGDGFDDLAIGVSRESVGGKADAGSVHVFYGSDSLLTTAGTQLWTADKNGVPASAAANDLFGESLAAGDFNGDGFDDLAIGAPRRTVGDVLNAGAAYVIYGSANGLRASGSQLWTQDSPGIPGACGKNDRFGSAVAAGDFNNDGFSDLAIGSPLDNVTQRIDCGVVTVINGGAGGLASADSKQWHQDLLDGANATEPFDQFGAVLCTGDFNGDGFADLAASATHETVGGQRDNGAVSVIFGSIAGLTGTDAQFFSRFNPTGDPTVATPAGIGVALAAGDIDGDGLDELAIGVPNYIDIDIETADTPTGVFWTLAGSVNGLLPGGGVMWYMDDATGGPRQAQANFGSAVSIVDINNDGFADLVVGATGYAIPPSTTNFVGGIIVLLGSEFGLEVFSGHALTQSSLGEFAEAGDRMGASLSK